MVKARLGVGLLALLFLAGTVSAQEPGKTGEEPEPFTFKFGDEKALATKEDPTKVDMEAAGEGDKKEFHIRTDDDISALKKGDVYRGTDERTFYEVSEIKSQSAAGGEFNVKRIRGLGQPGTRYVRVKADRAKDERDPPYVIAVRLTLLDLYEMGGAFLHPIAVLMVAMIVMSANSIWIYRRRRQIPGDFLRDASAALETGNVSRVQELADKATGLFPHIVRQMVLDWETSSIKDMRERAAAAGAVAVTRLKIPVKALNLIAAAAPLLGLLGTIVGMVMVFEAVATSTGAAKATALAAGIRVKLFCTAFALMVAIPSLFLFFIFNQRLNMLIAECEGLSTEFLEKLGAIKRKLGWGAAATEVGLEADLEREEAEEEAGGEPAMSQQELELLRQLQAKARKSKAAVKS